MLKLNSSLVQSTVLMEFMTTFKMEEPMTHMLYPTSVRLLKTAMSRLIKKQGLH